MTSEPTQDELDGVLETVLGDESPALERSISRDKFDEKVQARWQGSLDDEQAIPEGRDDIKALVDDTFMSLFKMQPKLAEAADMAPEYRAEREAMSAIMEMPEWELLRNFTQLDPEKAGNAVLSLHEQMVQALPEPDPKRDPKEPLSEEEIERIHRQARVKMRESITETTETLEAAYGIGDQSGTGGQKVTPADVQRIKRAPALRKILRLATKFRTRTSGLFRDRTSHGYDEIVGIKFSDEIESILPEEMVGLATPEGEVEFYRKYRDKQLLTLDTRETAKKNLGPIYVCVDHSGSMCGAPFEWAAAIFLAFALVAQRSKRDVCYLAFNTQVAEFHYFEKGDVTLQGLMRLTDEQHSGGTCFTPAFEAVIDEMKKRAEQHGEVRQTEMVMLTDGFAGLELPPEFIPWRNEKKLRLITAFIQTPASGPLKEISSSIAEVWDLESDVQILEAALA